MISGYFNKVLLEGIILCVYNGLYTYRINYKYNQQSKL